jgi:hypothetical protein
MGTPQPRFSLPKLARMRGIEGFPPRTPLTLELRKPHPFTHGFWRGIKGKRTMKGSCIHPPPNAKEKGLKTSIRNSPRKGSENHQKGKNRKNTIKP